MGDFICPKMAYLLCGVPCIIVACIKSLCDRCPFRESPCVALAGVELTATFPSQPLESWGYMWAPSCLAIPAFAPDINFCSSDPRCLHILTLPIASTVPPSPLATVAVLGSQQASLPPPGHGLSLHTPPTGSLKHNRLQDSPL